MKFRAVGCPSGLPHRCPVSNSVHTSTSKAKRNSQEVLPISILRKRLEKRESLLAQSKTECEAAQQKLLKHLQGLEAMTLKAMQSQYGW